MHLLCSTLLIELFLHQLPMLSSIWLLALLLIFSLQTFDPSTGSALDNLLFRLSSHSLENLAVASDRDAFLSRQSDQSSAAAALQYFDRFEVAASFSF